jgi:hypothetical protein
MRSLLPYDGLRKLEHFGSGGGPYVTNAYGFDRSGSKTYRINSLGFRGQEPSEEPRARIFVCGCSYTFGVGLNAEELWAYKVKDRVAAAWGLDPMQVDLLNFSQGGASNCYIVRMLVCQSTRLRPDLLLALFTHKARYELYDHDRTVYVMPRWVGMYRNTEWAERVEHSWLGMTEHDLAMRYLKNVLMLQWYCKANEIPFLFGSIEDMVNEGYFEKIRTPVTEPLLAAIDFDRLVPLRASMCVDKAADGSHPGPLSHDLMAEAFWQSYQNRYGQRTHSSVTSD